MQNTQWNAESDKSVQTRWQQNGKTQVQFSHAKPLFSTWNIKTQSKRFFLFPWDYYTVYSNQSHGTALFILRLIQKFQMFRDRHRLLYRVEPYTHRASRESSSSVYLLCCYHRTHGCALTWKKATKGDQNWNWSRGSSGSPFLTLLSHLYILLSTQKDLPLMEASKQIIKSDKS